MQAMNQHMESSFLRQKNNKREPPYCFSDVISQINYNWLNCFEPQSRIAQ